MIKSANLKIVEVSFIILSFLTGFVVRVSFESLAVVFGPVANYYNQDIFRHGLPILAGLSLFLFLNLKTSVKQLADEVVTEVKKVVWPTKKELYAMTSVVSVILLVSGIVLGLFDLTAGTSVRFFLE